MIEAMKQALEVLEDFVDDPRAQKQIDEASISLRQAIAEAEKIVPSDYPNSHQPVAWIENLTDPQPHAVTDLKYCSVAQRESGEDLKYVPLYPAPVHASDISQERVDEIGRAHV